MYQLPLAPSPLLLLQFRWIQLLTLGRSFEGPFYLIGFRLFKQGINLLQELGGGIISSK
jgi:hypothetical protein